jgi:transcriptional regulator with XRE-family HTH domain
MTPPVAQQIGQRLRAARLRASFSVLQAARSCRIRYAKLFAWEAGEDRPGADELGRFARLVDTSPDRLLPPAVFEMWGIDPAAARHAFEAATLAECPAPNRKRRLEVAPAGRLLPLRCDRCGRWFSAHPCAHGRVRSAWGSKHAPGTSISGAVAASTPPRVGR